MLIRRLSKLFNALYAVIKDVIHRRCQMLALDPSPNRRVLSNDSDIAQHKFYYLLSYKLIYAHD